MNVSDVLRALPSNGPAAGGAPRVGGSGGAESFSETLKQFVGDVNAAQQDVVSVANRFVAGENVELHEVMIASEKARTSFDLLMELRNKALEAYRELMRMQV